MIEVELPDGSIAEFPDGTSQDVIRTALQKRFGGGQAQPAAPVDDPWYVDAARAADDMARLAASGMTFGFADKIAGYLGGEGTEAERAKTQGARDRAGMAGNVAEIGGAFAVPFGLGNQGVSLAGRFGTGAMEGVKGLAARTGLMAAEGAGYGALTAAGNDQDIGTGALTGMAAGGAGNVIGEGLSAGVSKVAELFNKKPPIPGIDDLRAAKTAAYKAVDDAGHTYAATEFDDLIRGMTDEMKASNLSPMRHPKAASMMEDIQALGGSTPTLTQLDQLRQTIARDVAGATDPAERFFGKKMIDNIDEFIAASGAGDDLVKARGLTARVKKLEKVGKAQEVAEINADVSGAGTNIDNTTRQRIAAILKNDKQKRGFTPDELAAMKDVTRDGTGQKALRLAGKFAPTGVVSGVLSGGGSYAALGPFGLAIPAAGIAAKTAADKITKGKVDELVRIIAAGGSKAATKAPPNAVQRLAESQRDALVRLLMAGGINQALSAQ